MELIDESLSLFRIGETLFYRGVILNRINKKKEALDDLKEAVHLYDRCLNVGAFYEEWLHTHIPACLEVVQLELQSSNYQVAETYIEKASLLNLTYEVGFDQIIEAKRKSLENAKRPQNLDQRNVQVCDDILEQIQRQDTQTRRMQEEKNEPEIRSSIKEELGLVDLVDQISPVRQKCLQLKFDKKEEIQREKDDLQESMKQEVEYNLKKKNYRVALFIVDSYLENKQDREGFIQRSRVLQHLGRNAEAKAYADLAQQYLY